MSKLEQIRNVLQDEHGQWRELRSCADAVQDISLILAAPDEEPTSKSRRYCPMCDVWMAGRHQHCPACGMPTERQAR